MIILEDADHPSAVAKKVVKYLRIYEKELGFTKWQLYVRYCQIGKKRRKWTELNNKADCESSAEYYKAYLRFDLELLSQKSDGELARFVRHELLHAVVSPLANFALELAKSDAERYQVGILEEHTVSDLERMPIMDLE